TPRTVAVLRPGVEVAALAAVIDVAIDRRRAAERLAARREDAAAGGAFARLLRIAPVDARIVEGLDEAGGQMDVWVPVGRPRFQHADCGALVLAQPVGQHAAGGTGADDHVIERIHSKSRAAATVRPCEACPRRCGASMRSASLA